MSRPLFVEPEAAADLDDAIQWYESRSTGLGLEFARVVRATLAGIERAPLQFPEAAAGIRSAVLRRFPYAMYSVIDTECVAVIELFHHRRDPGRWQARR